MKHRTLLLSILTMMMMPAWAGDAKEENDMMKAMTEYIGE